MTQYFSPYNKIKNYIKNLADAGVTEAIEAMELYDEMKEQNGEFMAAKALMECYNLMVTDLQTQGMTI